MSRRLCWLGIFLALNALPVSAQPGAAVTQAPTKLVVGFAAGGPLDFVARSFAERAAKSLAQPFIVENKPGANAVLATEAVAVAKPDGLTLLAAATNHTMIPALYADRVKFDADKSFKPVCTLAAAATVLVVGPGLGAKSVAEFLVAIRTRPGGATYATPGVGSSPHLATATFQRLTETRMVHIPYKGAAPAIADLLGGQVDLSFATLGSVLPHIRSGRLVALAVASRERSALLPQVPTFDEAGVKNFVVDTWYGVLAPAGVGGEAYERIAREAAAFGRAPEVRERLAATGLEPHTLCGEAFAAQIRREIASNTALGRELNLRLE